MEIKIKAPAEVRNEKTPAYKQVPNVKTPVPQQVKNIPFNNGNTVSTERQQGLESEKLKGILAERDLYMSKQSENKDNQILPFDKNYCTYLEKKGYYKPLNIRENIKTLLDFYDIEIAYNQMSKEIEFKYEGSSRESDNRNGNFLEYVYNKCIINKFTGLSMDRLDSMLTFIADDNKYHPVKDWIVECYKKYKNKGLENEKEFNKLCESLKVSNGFDEDLKNNLIRTWLISCVSAVFSKKGFKYENVLTLQGKQGIYKTTFLKKLSPCQEWFKDGAELDPSDKDKTFQCIKYWLVELGELETTFKKDLGRLKAYLSKDSDEMRRPYAKKESKFPRRTVYCASVNYAEFLKDETGSRRFWVIPVENIDIEVDINIEKLWSEVYQMYLNGEKHYLSKDIENKLEISNRNFEEKTYTQMLLESYFPFHDDKCINKFWLLTEEIYFEMNRPHGISKTAITRTLNKMGIESKGVGGRKTKYLIPTHNERVWSKKYKSKQITNNADDEVVNLFN